MGTPAQVDEFPLPVQRNLLVLGKVLDDLGLVVFPLVGEEPDGLRAVPHLARHRLVAGHDFAHARLDVLQVVGGERRRPREIVVEAVLDHRADGDLDFGVQFLDRLGHDVGGVVAQQCEPVVVPGGNDGHLGVLFDDRRKVLDRAVHADGQRRLGQTRADVGRKPGPGNGTVERAHAAVR